MWWPRRWPAPCLCWPIAAQRRPPDEIVAVDAGSTDDTAAQIDPRRSVFLPDCFGRRSGSAHELGLTLGANPYGRLFLLADYRFSALLTDPQPSYRVQGAANPLAVQPVATVLGHAALLRIELGL